MVKVCCNCRWYSPRPKNDETGLCIYPVPFWAQHRNIVDDGEGSNCQRFDPTPNPGEKP
jgi:hypothetical protein